MEEQQFANGEMEIDLLELAGVLLRKLKLLIFCTIAGAAAAGAITYFGITPQYTGSSTIYILTKTTSVTSLADIQLGAALTTDFSLLVTSRPTLEQVIEELDLDYTTNQLKKMITVSNPSDTRFLQIDVESPDPQEAADISNALSNATADRVEDIMNTDRPTIVEKAIVPEKPSSPNLFKNVALGGFFCLLLCAAAVIVIFLLDDTIKTEDDVVKYLGLNTLAALPVDESAEIAGGKRRTQQKHVPVKKEKRKTGKGTGK